ncbi:MAG TPA: hypothetical protein PLX06_11645 [Fimbriimonadaceae bacterium]|nr:hypothetical protein [Fimbriimonadaceae bacterium]
MDRAAYFYRSLSLPTLRPNLVEEFYGGSLGLEVVRGPRGLDIQIGATKLCFVKSEIAASFHFAIDIPENQIREAHAWLHERAPVVRSGEFEVHRFESWNADAVYFFDPAGNIVEFIGRHSLPNASELPFGPRSLLAVSELGIPVPDVAAALDDVGRSLGWTPYRDPAPDFAAVGSELGLLILVREGRTWFPTESMAAQSFPAAIEIDIATRFKPFQIGGTEIRLFSAD